MRGASFLRRTLEASVELESAANYLRLAKTPQELARAWWERCDGTEGAVREELQAVYRACLTRLAPMHLAG